MRASRLLPFLLAAALPLAAQSVDIHIGTRFESFGVIGADKEFTLAPGARLYAWMDIQRVNAPTALTVVWKREGREVLRHTLAVRADHSAAISLRHFAAGEDGHWTVQVFSASGVELGTAAFTVTVTPPAGGPARSAPALLPPLPPPFVN